MMQSNFLSSLVAGILPMLFKAVAKLSHADKVAVALYVRDLAQAYETGDRLTFERLLAVTELIPADLRAGMLEALWSDVEQPVKR